MASHPNRPAGPSSGARASTTRPALASVTTSVAACAVSLTQFRRSPTAARLLAWVTAPPRSVTTT